MIPQNIADAIDALPGNHKRRPEDLPKVEENLARLGLLEHDQIADFYRTYMSASIGRDGMAELLDICVPNDSLFNATEFACDAYDLRGPFVCLTTGEGEGFYLFDKDTGGIFDVAVSDFGALEAGELKPAWPNFLALIESYVIENDAVN